jgi:predicted dinucleotide-binding enzyme
MDIAVIGAGRVGQALGFEAAAAGPLTNARLLEVHAVLWVDQTFKREQPRSPAFALSRI